MIKLVMKYYIFKIRKEIKRKIKVKKYSKWELKFKIK